MPASAVWSTPFTLQTNALELAVLFVLAVKLTVPLAQTGNAVVVLMLMLGKEVAKGETLQPTETELRFTTSNPAAISFGSRFFFATPLLTVDAMTSVVELCKVCVIWCV